MHDAIEVVAPDSYGRLVAYAKTSVTKPVRSVRFGQHRFDVCNGSPVHRLDRSDREMVASYCAKCNAMQSERIRSGESSGWHHRRGRADAMVV